jgi:hypothetical protein
MADKFQNWPNFASYRTESVVGTISGLILLVIIFGTAFGLW